jgi:hypothetical protein
MDEQFKFKKQLSNILIIIISAGILISVASILISKPGSPRIWANILLNNQYFMGIALGAGFFLAVHRVALSGWHTLIQRIPQAMTTFLPVAFVLMLLIWFGMHNLYSWTDTTIHDKVIEGKRAWLNIPFFYVRMVIYFAGWILLTYMMRKNSMALSDSTDIRFYNRSKIFASIFLVFFAISVSMSSWDWIMSLDAKWYSTLFGWYVLIGMFVTSLAFITIILWFLRRQGYLPQLRPDHFHDMAIYMFSFSIFWTYQWFAQYELIWYGHLPEETSYYITRLHEFKIIFFVNLAVNFLVPFFGLITFNAKRQPGWIASIAAVMLAGHWIDYWLMIMPATAGVNARIGVLEICMTVVYASLFIFIVFRSLASGPLVIKNDPFIEESLSYES